MRGLDPQNQVWCVLGSEGACPEGYKPCLELGWQSRDPQISQEKGLGRLLTPGWAQREVGALPARTGGAPGVSPSPGSG